MGKLILEIQTSLDGFIASTDGNTNWMLWNWSPEWTWDKELQHYHNTLTLSADCILISKQMAEEGFIAHWQNVTMNSNSPQYTFARHITDTRKVVFSKTLNKATPIPGGWDNTDIVEGDFVSAINKLKQHYHKDILVYGGASFVSSLIKANLIDEFHLLVNPVAIGTGMAIFNTIDNKQNMTLVKSKSYSCGIVLLHYKSNPSLV
jgi:dihydrofolate reductase